MIPELNKIIREKEKYTEKEQEFITILEKLDERLEKIEKKSQNE